jgi:CRISPR-associated protein Csd1
MLLQRLVEYAGRDDAAPAFHVERSFDWQLSLDRTGQPLAQSVQPLTTQDAKGRARGVPHIVPAIVRTVGVAANLAADDAQYVLGWGDDTTRPDRVQQCHAAFVELTRRWADSAPGRNDPVAQAVWAFYRDGHASSIRRPEACSAKARVLIVVDGEPAYRAPSVVLFWADEVARSKGSARGAGLCLACGKSRPLLDSLPGNVPAWLVPGASNSAALVSVNERVFGYDLAIKLGASPICVGCGEAVTAGLVRALDSGHAATYPGQNTRMAWWTTAPTSFDPMSLIGEPGDEAVTLLQSVHTGRPPSFDESVTFCSLSVGGNVARVMVRDWIEMPLTNVRDNLATWFDDHQTEPVQRDGRRFHGIGRLTLACGRWIRKPGRNGGYARFDDKAADRPVGVHHDLVRAALRGTPAPASLLAHLVHRVRTDGHIDDPRAALLRLLLTRHPYVTEPPMPGLDPDNTNPAYVAGRTFAVLEQIQYDASGGDLNATYGDRYFAGALANPRAALVSGRADARSWLRKLRRDPKKKGQLIRHEQQLDTLFNLFGSDTGIPGRTNVREQALFLLGYHHQRAHRFAAIAAAKATHTPALPADDPQETQP